MSNVNLNLATEDVSRDELNKPGRGVAFFLIILILALLLYGALLYFNRNLSSQITAVQGQYQEEFNKFLAGDGNGVIDFENRSLAAKELMVKDESITGILGKVEESILPSVYLNSFEYDKDKKEISLTCVGNNLNTAAKQILSFKQNDYFSEVTPGSSTLNTQSNELNFKIDLKIK